MRYKSFTSESVAEGHPDKICDQISDAILDVALARDAQSRVAVETLVTTNRVSLAGEVTTKADLNYAEIASNVVKDIGYTEDLYEFTHRSPIDVHIHQQSQDIAKGVDGGGAGDQGMMFGYAVDETEELMPLPITLAHRLIEAADWARKDKILPYLRPDGKSQVKVLYENGKPQAVERVVLAVPHDPRITNKELKKELYERVVSPVLERYGYKISPKDLIVNGAGKWEIGGPASDTGVTGRKIIVDTYGGMARHGGGCFSGKDPTKVDRSGAYAARFIAKNIVAQNLAERCEVKAAYVIGQKEPLARQIETFGTEKKPIKAIEEFAWGLLDLSVPEILRELDLRRPIYRQTSCYGHFGREGFTWEEIR